MTTRPTIVVCEGDQTGQELHEQALREATLSSAAEGIRSFDLGGDASTSEVADEVIRRLRQRRAQRRGALRRRCRCTRCRRALATC
jgi:hypothetical protein